MWFKPDAVGDLVSNMRATAEGTLRSVNGPAPYQPQYEGAATFSYGDEVRSVYHARVGYRDILLAVVGDELWEHQGWTRSWRVLLGPASSSPVLEASIPSDGRPRHPIQFESTPQGIIICIPGTRPYFYDGEHIGALGYDQVPGSPQAHGPRSTQSDKSQNWGYVHTGVSGDAADGAWSGEWDAEDHHGMHPMFGYCRIGTLEQFQGTKNTTGGANPLGGTRLKGTWRAATQWVDRWGNRSPRSPSSEQVSCEYVENYTKEAFSTDRVDALRIQVAWSRIAKGPGQTVGRMLLRTKDQLHSGTLKMFEVPPNAAGGTSAFSTLPDNITDLYPDNTPDAWLLVEATDPEIVRSFDVMALFAGRLFVGNLNVDGRVMWSEPGLWGTFDKANFVYPDPSGMRVTGMHATDKGLLVWTEDNTFIVTQSDDGQRFLTALVSSRVGCVAPRSVATLPSGVVVWLGHEGFYAWDGGEPIRISAGIKLLTDTFNQGHVIKAVAAVDQLSEEYRCWVPVDGARDPNLCIIFDGDGNWRRRDDAQVVRGVCVTKDHRRYMITAGQAQKSGSSAEEGVWVLDHETPGFLPPSSRYAVVRTGWVGNSRSHKEKAPIKLLAALVETTNGRLEADLYVNWRLVSVSNNLLVDADDEEAAGWLYTRKDAPLFWGTAVYDGSSHDSQLDVTTTHTWQRRRPFWSNPLDGGGRDAETYMYQLRHNGDFEFDGVIVGEVFRGYTSTGRKSR